jgi:hypothetical protein
MHIEAIQFLPVNTSTGDAGMSFLNSVLILNERTKKGNITGFI